MITLQFRVRNGGVSVRSHGWTGDTASVIENGLRSQLVAHLRRGQACELSLDEAKAFINSLVVFAAACPQALQLDGVGKVIAFDGGISMPHAPGRPVIVDLWVEGAVVCAQIAEGRWFEEDLAASMPEGSVVDEDGVWRVPLGAESYRAMVFLGLFRACYPQTLQLRGLRDVVTEWATRRRAVQ